MEIKKGTLLKIRHDRKGTFMGVASEDFDSEKDEWYPIVIAPDSYAESKITNTTWEDGEEVPCRNTLCKIEIAPLTL